MTGEFNELANSITGQLARLTVLANDATARALIEVARCCVKDAGRAVALLAEQDARVDGPPSILNEIGAVE